LAGEEGVRLDRDVVVRWPVAIVTLPSRSSGKTREGRGTPMQRTDF